MKHIVVIGGSKGIGKATVEALLQSGYAVTAFARSADHMTLRHDNLTCISGDATKPSDVVAALEGADAVVLALGIPMSMKFLTGPISLFSDATKTVLDVMQTLNIRRVVAVTGFGAGTSKQAINCLQRLPFKIIFGKVYADKTTQENLIKAADADWTLVRPGVLTNQPLKPGYRVRQSPEEWRNGTIPRAAVGDYIARIIFETDSYGQEPVLSN